MLNLPIYRLAIANSAVTDLLGVGDDCRVYPFGEAPKEVGHPYAVYQLVGGQPENYLGELPDIDRLQVQVDVYGKSPAEVRAAVQALARVIEPSGYITRWGGAERDPTTRNYRIGFDAEFFTER